MTTNKIQDLFNKTAYDVDGEKLGSVDEIFVDDNSGQPTFVQVSHGLFGLKDSIVPLRGHKVDGENLVLAFSKDRIKDAPNVDSDRALTTQEQDEVYRHYGIDQVEGTQFYETGAKTDTRESDLKTGAGAGAGAGAAAGAGVAGAHERTAETDAAAKKDVASDKDAAADKTPAEGDALIRSEEQLDVQKDRVATGEVRLRKYVVSDTEHIEVPVTREEVRVERTPISAEEAAKLKENGGDLGDDETHVTLHEDRVTVNKETVPVEKVELNKTAVQDTEHIEEEVRKERIEEDGIENNK